jgi:hypothetical protein
MRGGIIAFDDRTESAVDIADVGAIEDGARACSMIDDICIGHGESSGSGILANGMKDEDRSAQR